MPRRRIDAGGAGGEMRGWIPTMTGKPRHAVVWAAAAFAIVLGAVDYLTGPLVSLNIFYLFPVAMIAWYVGRRAAIAMSLACALIWFLADFETFRLHLSLALDLWNGVVRIGFFIIVSYLLTAWRTAIDRENRLARDIQERLLPSSVPAVSGLDVSAFYRPARDLSGDYFDLFGEEGGPLVICIADVAGKGLGPALLMANLQAAVRVLVPTGDSPAEICRRLNKVVGNNVTPERFITFFICWIDADRTRIVYANAGHNLPLLFRRDGSMTALEQHGPVLGVFAEALYGDGAEALGPGDRLVLFTDGLPEAQNDAGELFGEERLVETVLRHGPGSAEALQKRLLEAVDAFSGGDLSDDLTLLVVNVTAGLPSHGDSTAAIGSGAAVSNTQRPL